MRPRLHWQRLRRCHRCVPAKLRRPRPVRHGGPLYLRLWLHRSRLRPRYLSIMPGCVLWARPVHRWHVLVQLRIRGRSVLPARREPRLQRQLLRRRLVRRWLVCVRCWPRRRRMRACTRAAHILSSQLLGARPVHMHILRPGQQVLMRVRPRLVGAVVCALRRQASGAGLPEGMQRSRGVRARGVRVRHAAHWLRLLAPRAARRVRGRLQRPWRVPRRAIERGTSWRCSLEPSAADPCAVFP